MSVREADRSLGLNGAGHGLLDTTHFDTVRFPPPDWALPTFAAAADDGELAYTAYRGSDDVRRICARSISSLMGMDVDPSRNLAITAGTQAGLFAVLGALVDEGDVVVLADPEYLFVERMLRFLGAEVVRLPFVDSPTGPELDLDQLETVSARGIRLLLTSNPHNPTGAVLGPEAIARLARIAIRDDFLVVIDALYCRLVYGDTSYTHLAAEPGMAERTITLLGGSKTESLSGYRVGMVVGPGPIIDSVEQMIAMLCLRAPAYAQQVMTRWLVDDHDFVAQRVLELQAIQRTTVAALTHGARPERAPRKRDRLPVARRLGARPDRRRGRPRAPGRGRCCGQPRLPVRPVGHRALPHLLRPRRGPVGGRAGPDDRRADRGIQAHRGDCIRPLSLTDRSSQP